MAYSFKDKVRNVRVLNNLMLAKTLSMFEYSGLPDTIPAKELEKLLQVRGVAFVAEVNGKLYALSGTIGGEQDAYGNGTKFLVANPWLNFNKELDIEKDGVLFVNDDMQMGLMPIFERGNTFLVENDITMMLWGYNSRTQKLISAPDDRTKESAELYVKRIIEGEISIIAENTMFDGVKVQGGNNSSSVNAQQLTEFNQYIKASMYNEVGISSNFNMKRERLISSELDAAEDSLFPLVYNMMQNRIESVKRLNEMFNLNVEVDFGSIWALKNKDLVDGDPSNNHKEGLENGQERKDNLGDSSGSGSDDYQNDNREEVTDGDGERERERERGQGQGTDAETDARELQAIIDDPDASDEDKQAARELLQEQENSYVRIHNFKRLVS